MTIMSDLAADSSQRDSARLSEVIDPSCEILQDPRVSSSNHSKRPVESQASKVTGRFAILTDPSVDYGRCLLRY